MEKLEQWFRIEQRGMALWRSQCLRCHKLATGTVLVDVISLAIAHSMKEHGNSPTLCELYGPKEEQVEEKVEALTVA